MTGDAAVLSDAELIAAVRAGDTNAFAPLYERHGAAAQTVARQYTRSQADAEDITSDAFAKVLSVIAAGGGPDEAFRAYLFTVVRRLAFAWAQSGRRVQPTDDVATFESAYGPAGSVEEPALEGFERTVVARAYDALPERWQAVLWYTEVEGRSAAEIAPLLGISANGVAALTYRAREGLRQGYLQQHLSTAPTKECAGVVDKLGAYVRGGLAARDTSTVEAHLAGCTECQALVGELGDVNHGMRAIVAPLVLGIAGLGAFAGLGALAGGGSAASSGPDGIPDDGGVWAQPAGGASATGGSAATTAGGAATGGGLASLVTVPVVGAAALVLVLGAVVVAVATGFFSPAKPASTQAAARELTVDEPGKPSPSGDPVGPDEQRDDPVDPPVPVDDGADLPDGGRTPTGPDDGRDDDGDGGRDPDDGDGGRDPDDGDDAPDPEDPETPEPEDPETPSPEDPETPSPEDPETPSPEDPETPGPEDPETPEPEEPAGPPSLGLPADQPTVRLAAGEPGTISFSIVNSGPSPAEDLAAAVTLPDGVVLTSGETVGAARALALLTRDARPSAVALLAGGTAWSCGPAPGDSSTTCTLGTLATGASAELSLDVDVVAATLGPAAVTIDITGEGLDPVTVQLPVEIQPALDLVVPGDDVVFVFDAAPVTVPLELRNATSSEIPDVVVNLSVPPEIKVDLSGVGDGWECPSLASRDDPEPATEHVACTSLEAVPAAADGEPGVLVLDLPLSWDYPNGRFEIEVSATREPHETARHTIGVVADVRAAWPGAAVVATVPEAEPDEVTEASLVIDLWAEGALEGVLYVRFPESLSEVSGPDLDADPRCVADLLGPGTRCLPVDAPTAGDDPLRPSWSFLASATWNAWFQEAPLDGVQLRLVLPATEELPERSVDIDPYVEVSGATPDLARD